MANTPDVLRLHPLDNVLVALADLPEGAPVADGTIICREPIPAGHKVASAPIGAGAGVTKYGQVIGAATRDIRAGDLVHTHNLGMERFERDYAIGEDARPQAEPPGPPEFFQGIVRPDGRVATRNYIGVISTVNCSSSVTRLVADRFHGEALADYPEVDGVVPICHGLGCGMAGSGRGFEYLRDSLAGYSRHPTCTRAWRMTWISTAARSPRARLRSQSLGASFFGACWRSPPAAAPKARRSASATTSSCPGRSGP